MVKIFELDTSLGFLLSKSNSSMKTYFNKLIRKNGIKASAEQWGILNIIQSADGITQNEIAARSLKDKTNITRMLDVMERNKYIERKNDKSDRRKFRIFITSKGESLLRQLAPLAIKTNQIAAAGLKKEEFIFLTNILNTIYFNTKD